MLVKVICSFQISVGSAHLPGIYLSSNSTLFYRSKLEEDRRVVDLREVDVVLAEGREDPAREFGRGVGRKRHEAAAAARAREPGSQLEALAPGLRRAVERVGAVGARELRRALRYTAPFLVECRLGHAPLAGLVEGDHEGGVDVVREDEDATARAAEELARVLPREGVPVQRVDEDQVGLGRDGRVHPADVLQDIAPHEGPALRRHRRADELRSEVVEVEGRERAFVAVARERRQDPARRRPAQRTDLEDAPRALDANRHVEHGRLDAADLALAHHLLVTPRQRRERLGRRELAADLVGELGHKRGIVRGERAGVRSVERVQVPRRRQKRAARGRPRRPATGPRSDEGDRHGHHA